MAKPSVGRAVGKTANIVFPLIGIGAIIAGGFFIHRRFFRGETQEEADASFFGAKQTGEREERGLFGNIESFFFGEKPGDATEQTTPNQQTTNITPGINGGSSIFGDFFKGIGQFFFPTQEGQSSPTQEDKVSDKLPGTDSPTGAGVAPIPAGFKQLPQGQTLRQLQINTKVFGQPPKRGGKITTSPSSFGSSSQKNPGNTTSNKPTSTQSKETQSTKQITTTPKSTGLSKFISGFSSKPPGTSRTSSSSSTSPKSSTSTTGKPTTAKPTTTGRRSGNTKTQNTGTGQTTQKPRFTSTTRKNTTGRRFS